MSCSNNHTLILSDKSFLGPSILLLDSAKRIKYNNSCWYSLFHRKEKQQLNNEMWQMVSNFFQQRYQIEDTQQFLRIWKKIGQKEWAVKSPFTVGKLRAIDDAFKKQLVYHGPGMSPLPPNSNHINPAVQQVANALLHGGSLSVDLIQKPLLRALLVKHDPILLKQFRIELQLELDQLAKNLPKNPREEIVWRQFLGNVIGLIPFSYPLENEIFTIPHLEMDNTCRQVPYTVQVIEITSRHSTTPISAIGFSPINDKQAPPILSFLGTTFPAGNGFCATVLGDFTPKMSVGEDVYRQGKDKITHWFKNKANVHVIGISLGGAMAFHTILDHHNNISRADVYNPPGLYEHCWKDRSFNDGCPINIYRQPGDIVSKMGFWPTGGKVEIFHVIPHQTGIVERMPRSHIQVFSGCRKVTFLKCDPMVENQNISRKALVFLHRNLGPYLFYYPTYFALCCYRMACAAQRCWKNWFKPQIT